MKAATQLNCRATQREEAVDRWWKCVATTTQVRYVRFTSRQRRQMGKAYNELLTASKTNVQTT